MSQLQVDQITDAAGTGAPRFPQGLSANAEIVLKQGNGHGSTNTEIRRFSTIETNSGGTAMTLTQSATDGDSITIDEAGLYAIHYTDSDAVGGDMGITLNSSELATAIENITVESDVLAHAAVPNGGNTVTLTVVERFAAGDIVRAHGLAGNSPSTSALKVRFRIRQLAKEE